jgi:hypothetical protein
VSFERFHLSKAALGWLAALVVMNLVLVAVIATREPDAGVPAAATERSSDGAPLRLLAELSREEREALERKPEELEERDLPQLVVEPPRLCRMWGPYTDLSVVEAVRELVRPVGEEMEIRSTEVVSSPDYLVYLNTDSNLDNARRLLKELEAQSIEGYVIAGGEFENSVSAGVFSSERRADRQMSRLSELGYSPRLEALERVQTVHHLLALVPVDFQLPDHEDSDCQAIARIP